MSMLGSWDQVRSKKLHYWTWSPGALQEHFLKHCLESGVWLRNLNIYGALSNHTNSLSIHFREKINFLNFYHKTSVSKELYMKYEVFFNQWHNNLGLKLNKCSFVTCAGKMNRNEHFCDHFSTTQPITLNKVSLESMCQHRFPMIPCSRVEWLKSYHKNAHYDSSCQHRSHFPSNF
jgi:hypothetical protein